MEGWHVSLQSYLLSLCLLMRCISNNIRFLRELHNVLVHQLALEVVIRAHDFVHTTWELLGKVLLLESLALTGGKASFACRDAIIALTRLQTASTKEASAGWLASLGGMKNMASTSDGRRISNFIFGNSSFDKQIDMAASH